MVSARSESPAPAVEQLDLHAALERFDHRVAARAIRQLIDGAQVGIVDFWLNA